MLACASSVGSDRNGKIGVTKMPIEHVSRTMGFDNLIVEVSVIRYICDCCARRECFHDVPTPYGEAVPTPQSRGWRILPAWTDGEEGARCPDCIRLDEQREAARKAREAEKVS